MRFSLFTLILISIWLGAAMLVWQWRNAWIAEKKTYTLTEFNDKFPALDVLSRKFGKSVGPPKMPNAELYIWLNANKTWVMLDNEKKELCAFSKVEDHLWVVPIGFIDNERCAFSEFQPESSLDDKNARCRIWFRRFPEWWWGHFYRPEVWALIGLTIILAWRFARTFLHHKTAADTLTTV